MLTLFGFRSSDAFLHFEPISQLKETFLISIAPFPLKNQVPVWKLIEMSLQTSEQGPMYEFSKQTQILVTNKLVFFVIKALVPLFNTWLLAHAQN